ncbi:MAG: hypothetical protein B0W54_12780 [Cellvibrio sp. 79]|nr:MAG: hypothetical protein B0W54_12780 [Cellvibrio sp. 79]
MKKVFLSLLATVFVVTLAGFIYVEKTLPVLPEETDGIIDNVLEHPLPELIVGQQGYVRSGEAAIWYEVIDTEKTPVGTVMLMMGISNDALGWPRHFLGSLREAGYRIIRYDYRGTGLSDWMINWDRAHPYNLNHLTADALAIIDALKIDKVHVLGISLGGMVAQQMAINHPNRVASLVSMMSSCDILDPELPPISMDVVKQFIFAQIRYGLISTEKNIIKLHLTSRAILRGEADYSLDTHPLAQSVLYNIRNRNGYNPKVSEQHNAAVMTSGSRAAPLAKLQMPTLIIHGEADPLIPIAHGAKCADIIPNSVFVRIPEMGHDLPSTFNESITNTLSRFWTLQSSAFNG